MPGIRSRLEFAFGFTGQIGFPHQTAYAPPAHRPLMAEQYLLESPGTIGRPAFVKLGADEARQSGIVFLGLCLPAL